MDICEQCGFTRLYRHTCWNRPTHTHTGFECGAL